MWYLAWDFEWAEDGINGWLGVTLSLLALSVKMVGLLRRFVGPYGLSREIMIPL
jgi:hypothetical protein